MDLRINKLVCDNCNKYKAIYPPRNGCASCWIYYLQQELTTKQRKYERV